MRREALGPYTYTVPGGCFPLGRDSLALGDFAAVRPGQRVCDLGCGAGLLLLLLARRAEGLALHGVELDPVAAQAARENLAANGLPGAIFTGDLRETPWTAGSFDLVVSNPPYFAAGSGRSGGPERMEGHTLAEWCAAAGRLTRNGGRFALVHRPERLTDLLCALRASRLEPKRLRFLQHDAAHPPAAVLVEGRKEGRPGLSVLPVLFTGG
ncbi:methyltransferase [Pseudoflavonifractor phocaeensis]|uniref:tRNA1(Val) (adenine(37)-N6)-methyltransferase n=1 Tax=Pseudoflavonifractor phocaeensis TaxID=1870988 RepID=UPI00195CB237|nr:methyltransferase [Pseudoflavonifractor phocaeensis]MBM6938912.1 methyltransferase [Pseudoflavonifractor phocaeensis]